MVELSNGIWGSTDWEDIADISALVVGDEVVVVAAAALVCEDEASCAGGAVVPATRRQYPTRHANRHLLQTRRRCAPMHPMC